MLVALVLGGFCSLNVGAAWAVEPSGSATADPLAMPQAPGASADERDGLSEPWWRRLSQRFQHHEQNALHVVSRHLGDGDGVFHVAYGWALGLPFIVSLMPAVEAVFAGKSAPVNSQVTAAINGMSSIYSGVLYVRKSRPKHLEQLQASPPAESGAEQTADASETPSAQPKGALKRLWSKLDEALIKNRRVAGGLTLAGITVSTKHPIHGTPYFLINIPQVGALMLGMGRQDEERVRLFGAVILLLAPLTPSSPLVAMEFSRSIRAPGLHRAVGKVVEKSRPAVAYLRARSAEAWAGSKAWGASCWAACRSRPVERARPPLGQPHLAVVSGGLSR